MRTQLSSNTVPSGEDFEAVLSEDDLRLLNQVIRSIGKRHRLNHDDELDFGQHVHLRLLESGYRQFRQFAGRSSLRTYLHVVVQRICLDWRRSLYGKWRPSAAAAELGPYGTELDRLIHRDGHTREQAVQILESERGAPPPATLKAMAESLPARVRLRVVPIESAHEAIGTVSDDPVDQAERLRQARRVQEALQAAVGQLSADDRRLLELRFEREQRVATTAVALQLDAKALYRRYDKMFRHLRNALETSGITGTDAATAARLTTH